MDSVDFTPIPQCQIPPVIHSVYIPNKPRQKVQLGPPQRLDSRADLLSRQHSYNHADYELQKRVKIQQRAQSQLISENPHLESLLTPHLTTTKLQPPPSPNTTLTTPGLINTTDLPPDDSQNTNPNNQQHPQRRAFGEMMRDGGFSTRTGPQGNNIPTPVLPSQQQHPISKSIDNLHNDELSDSDSFVMIEDNLPGHHNTKKQPKDDKKDKKDQKDKKDDNKGLTITEHGVKIWDNKKPPLGSNHKSLLCANVLHTSKGVDLSLIEPGHHTCLMTIDIIKHMQRGISVIKHGRRGKPHTCLLKLAQNCRSFSWDSKNKDDGENVIRFQWITAITQGQTSSVFQRNLDPRVEPLSLTILYTKPEKYIHINESDDDDIKTDTKTSFLPSFFAKKDKDGNKSNSNGGKHSSWKGINQDYTLDVVIEDPNDWLIWYNGCKILIDMANTKLIIDDSTKLTRKTIVQLSLPILSDYPSASWLVDVNNGLSVAEQIENEKQHENNQVQVQLALTRKETFKELIRRTSSYNDGSQMQLQVRQQLLQRHESQRLQRQSSQISINNTQPSLTPGSTNINLNSPPLTTQQSTTLSINTNNTSNGGDSINTIDNIDLLSDSFPSPWRTIEIIGTSDIVHSSWLQQLIYFGPKNGRSSPWTCAYTMSTTAATYQRVLERISLTPKEILGFEGKDKEILTQQEQIRRERLYKSHIQNCGSLSIIILRSKQGDILGGYATGNWCEKWGFYGSPDSYVFSIGQEEVTMALPDGIEQNLIQKQDNNNNTTTTTMTTTTPTSKQPKLLENGHVVLDEKIYQMHIYRWCGNGRFFQFVSQDAFGFGGNIIDEQDTSSTTNTNEQITGNNNNNNDKNNNNNTTTKSTTVDDTLPLQIGNGTMQSTGPALTLSRTLDIGYSLPCPIFQSPQLTKSKQWSALQMEVWIPVPKL